VEAAALIGSNKKMSPFESFLIVVTALDGERQGGLLVAFSWMTTTVMVQQNGGQCSTRMQRYFGTMYR